MVRDKKKRLQKYVPIIVGFFLSVTLLNDSLTIPIIIIFVSTQNVKGTAISGIEKVGALL